MGSGAGYASDASLNNLYQWRIALGKETLADKFALEGTVYMFYHCADGVISLQNINDGPTTWHTLTHFLMDNNVHLLFLSQIEFGNEP